MWVDYWGGPKGMLPPPQIIFWGGGGAAPHPLSSYAYGVQACGYGDTHMFYVRYCYDHKQG